MIPTKWDNITVEQYLKLRDTMDVEVKDAEHALDIGVEQVRIVTGDYGLEDSQVHLRDLTAVQNLVKSEMPNRIIEQFVLNGQRYKVRLYPDQLPAGDYITIMNLAKKGDAYLHQILFTICRPLKKGLYKTEDKLLPKKYGWHEFDFEAHELKDKINDFKQLPLKVAIPLRSFFLRVSTELTELIQDYSLNELTKMGKKLESIKEDLQSDTDGL